MPSEHYHLFRLVGGFSPGTPVSPTNKTDRHDIAEILLKVTLNIIKQTNNIIICIKYNEYLKLLK